MEWEAWGGCRVIQGQGCFYKKNLSWMLGIAKNPRDVSRFRKNLREILDKFLRAREKLRKIETLMGTKKI